MTITVLSATDLARLPKTDPRFFKDKDGITLQWAGYDYFISWNRIDTPEKALGWLVQVSEKSTKRWKDMTPGRIAHFICVVSDHFKWTIHGII